MPKTEEKKGRLAVVGKKLQNAGKNIGALVKRWFSTFKEKCAVGTNRLRDAMKKLGGTFQKWLFALKAKLNTVMIGGRLSRRSILTLTAAAGGVLVLVVCFMLASANSDADDARITSDALDAVTVDASFLPLSGTVLLHTDGRIDESYLKTYLKAEPAQPLSVTRLTDRFFAVRFLSPPEDDLELKLKNKNFSTYYQSFPIKHQQLGTEPGLKLVSESRLDEVGISEPLLLMFSGDVLQPELLSKLEISEPTDIDVKCSGSIAVITPKTPFNYDQRYKITVSAGLMTASGEKMTRGYYNEFVTARAPVVDARGFNREAGPTAQKNQELTVKFVMAPESQNPNGTVTMVFSDEISQDVLQSYISIRPNMGYELTCEGNVAVIAPKINASGVVSSINADGTVDTQQIQQYTLSVGTGMTSKKGARLNSLQEKAVYLPQVSKVKLTLTNQISNAVDVSKPIMLEFLMENSPLNNQLLELGIYNVNSYEQYKKLLQSDLIKQDFGLARISGHAEIIHEGLNSVELANPGKGTYLIKADMVDSKSGETISMFKCVHVTDLSVYLQTADQQSVIWVNSTVTKQPSAGLEVSVSSSAGDLLAEGTTDAGGYAILKYKDDSDAVWEKKMDSKRLLELRQSDGKLLYADITATPSVTGETDPVDLYYSVFYSDRNLYHPTDTISVWGFVKPYMLNKKPLPDTVRLSFDLGGMEQISYVNLLPNGTYSGEIDVEKLVSGGYSVEAELLFPDGTKRGIGSLWLNVKEFEKPTFVLTTKASRTLYVAGEDIEASAELTSYDGTPLPQYPLELTVFNIYDGNIEETRKIETDSAGKVSFKFKPDAGFGRTNEGGPVEHYYMITLANDGEKVQKRGNYFCQSSEILADADFTIEGGCDFTLAVKTAKADGSLVADAEQLTELINSYNEYQYSGGKGYSRYYRDERKIFSVLAGDTIDIGVKGRIEVSYTSITGERVSESRDLSMVTKDGAGTFAWRLKEPCDTENAFVNITLICVDDRLNQSQFVFVSGNEQPFEEPQRKPPSKGYVLSVTRQGETTPLEADMNYMGHEEITVRAGDALAFALMHDGVRVPDQDQGRIFWMLIQNREISHGLSDGHEFYLEMKPEHARSVIMCAAFFDGVDTYPISDTMMRMEMESVSLDVSVTPDKTEYFPGDYVNLAVHVADEKGAPVKSSVCVSVVDESIFALSEQSVNVLESLYGELSFGNLWVRKYTTTIGDEKREPYSGDGGKGGGNLDAYDIIRENFKDTALFLPAATDEAGNASINFKLPDNTTSWRITTLSVGDNMYGGQGKDNIISTMPFYSKPIITSQYLEGDEVALLLQGHGTALNEDSDINYILNIAGNGVDKTITASGKAYAPVLANLGKLAAGDYIISATSSYMRMSDTVKLPLTVISSNLEMLVSREIDPGDISKINANRFPLTLTLMDREHMPFYKSVSRLFTHFCDRADQRLSRYVAKQALAKYYDAADIPRHIRESGSNIYYMQKNDGGIGWYREDKDSDPVLTAKTVLAVGAQPFSVPRIKKYLTETAENHSDGETRALAYAALASIEPSTVTEINRILEEGNMQMKEKLYYIAGLGAGGDTEHAKEIYLRDVAPFIVAANGGKRMEYANVRGDDNELTAAAWIAASKNGMPDAESFSLYFSQDAWGISTIFECMIYVSGYSKIVPSVDPITYTANGVTRSISLGVTGQKSMTFLSKEFSSLSFGYVPENLSVMAYYVGEPEEADMKQSPNFTVEKTMKDEGEQGIRNTIIVNFDVNAPTGRYDISDFVPSDMRFFSMIKPKGDNSRPNVIERQELQKIYFSFSRNVECRSVTIEYYTRRTFEAKTFQDRVYVIHADTGETAFSERRESV